MSERELRRIFLLAALMREFYGPDELASWFYAPLRHSPFANQERGFRCGSEIKPDFR